jgi:hypothetical protein
MEGVEMVVGRKEVIETALEAIKLLDLEVDVEKGPMQQMPMQIEDPTIFDLLGQLECSRLKGNNDKAACRVAMDTCMPLVGVKDEHTKAFAAMVTKELPDFNPEGTDLSDYVMKLAPDVRDKFTSQAIALYSRSINDNSHHVAPCMKAIKNISPAGGAELIIQGLKARSTITGNPIPLYTTMDAKYINNVHNIVDTVPSSMEWLISAGKAWVSGQG